MSVIIRNNFFQKFHYIIIWHDVKTWLMISDKCHILTHLLNEAIFRMSIIIRLIPL